MKRFILSACITTIIAAPLLAAAQPGAVAPTPQRRLSGGLVLGASFANFGGDEVAPVGPDVTIEANLEPSEKLLAGGFVTIMLSPRYALEVQALYSERGGQGSFVVPTPSGTVVSASLDHMLRYVQIPVLARLYIEYDADITPYLFAGPALAVLIGSAADGQAAELDAGGQPVMSTDISADIGDVSERLDLSLIAGAGIGFPLSRGRLLLSVRYELGVTTAMDGTFTLEMEGGGGTPLEARSLRNRGLSLLLGYQL